MAKQKHLVLVFPADSSAATLAPLGRALLSSMTEACGEVPVFVRPNATALCLLCAGPLPAVSKAVADVTDAYTRWLVLPVAAPFEAHGLSTAVQWLSRPQ